jgi:outer membrane protein OmpA-like peptidoglycan-associated protein
MVADAYLLSTPQLIGSVTATPTGTGSITVTVPAAMKTGSHTLQVVGRDTRGRSLIVAVGLTVAKAPTTMGTRVYFPFGSSKLSRSAKATLRSMINQVNAEGMLNSSARVSGVVRLTGAKTSDVQLAKKRSRAVSVYMKSLGFTGKLNMTTVKAPVRDRWSDRRVDISIKL